MPDLQYHRAEDDTGRGIRSGPILKVTADGEEEHPPGLTPQQSRQQTSVQIPSHSGAGSSSDDQQQTPTKSKGKGKGKASEETPNRPVKVVGIPTRTFSCIGNHHPDLKPLQLKLQQHNHSRLKPRRTVMNQKNTSKTMHNKDGRCFETESYQVKAKERMNPPQGPIQFLPCLPPLSPRSRLRQSSWRVSCLS
jgi:hypothetical protein